MMNALLAAAALALSATQLSCSVNDYCLNCGTEDGGTGSGSGDANDAGDIDAPVDAGCVPTGDEVCDDVDNDCNGLVDDNPTDVGGLCTNQMGECAGGTQTCDNGEIKCTKSPSPEICDFKDNNCNGTVDEGDPGGGGKCGTDLGECIAGTLRCQGFAGCDSSANCTTNCCVTCDNFVDRRNDPEACNSRDDDCDGNFDEGLTNVGSCTWPGATDTGECNIGTLSCMAGAQVCNGAVFPSFEICDGLDNNCNGQADEIFNKQTDPMNCNTCGNVCATPSKTCINSQNAGASCSTDATCMGGQCVVNSQPRCTGGSCGIRCNVGFINADQNNANGCEFFCTPTGAEVCDGVDNDCDGDIDENLVAPAICLTGGECSVGGNVTAQCTGAGGWVCPYQGQVEFPEVSCDGLNNDCDANTDEAHKPDVANHVLGAACNDGDSGVCLDTGLYVCNSGNPSGPLVCAIAEIVCNDSADDESDGRVNDGCPAVGAAETNCTDSMDNDADGFINDGCPPVGTQEAAPEPNTLVEDCNAKDDDCNGQIDEGTLTNQEWVDIGNGKQMLKYEASRPDATASFTGVNDSIVCSGANRIPWTNIKYADAVAACQSIGANLCSESDWHRTCSDVDGQTYPASATTGTALVIEAEYYSGIAHATQTTGSESGGNCNNSVDDDLDGLINDGCPASGAAETLCSSNGDEDSDGLVNDGCPAAASVTRSWVPDYTTGYSAIAAMEATPNSGGTIVLGSATTQAPRLDFQVNFTQTGTYYVYAKVFANSSADDLLHAGISGLSNQSFPAPAFGSWVWVRTPSTFNVNTTGNRTVCIWMGDDGVKVDKIAVSTSATAPVDVVASKGGTWAYASSPNTYQPNTCNGEDYDTNGGVSGNQDDVIATGSLASCRSLRGSDVFDMSGNVKEWTLAHQPGENPIRGGGSNNTDVGISCALNFTLADDDFFFPNIGFRCCK